MQRLLYYTYLRENVDDKKNTMDLSTLLSTASVDVVMRPGPKSLPVTGIVERIF